MAESDVGGALGASSSRRSAAVGVAEYTLPVAAAGVHVGDGASGWIVRRRKYRRQLLGLSKRQAPPDLSIDPRTGLLSFINADDVAKAFFVSVRGHACRGAAGHQLANALSPLAPGEEAAGQQQRRVTTFVVTVAPQELIDVCRLHGLRSPAEADVVSDIVPLGSCGATASADGATGRSKRLEAPMLCEPCNPLVLGFPFEAGRAYLCSQGFDGPLTHFAHPSTRYAIDLEAEVGTVVLAVANGTVHALRDGAPSGGVDVSLLFHYNALTLLLDDGSTTVEYVHILSGSACVAISEHVSKGQPLCRTGRAGFCPTPHLHLEAHRHGLQSDASPSDPIALEALHAVHQGHSASAAYVPVAGCWYEAAAGLVPAPATVAESRTACATDTVNTAAGRVAHISDSASEDSSGGWETVSDDES